MQIRLWDWVKIGEKWQLVKSIERNLVEDWFTLNDCKGTFVDRYFNETNHRSVDGPFKVGDLVQHKGYGQDVVIGFDSQKYLFCKTWGRPWTMMVEDCKLIKPVEAFEQEKPKEKSFEEAVAERFQELAKMNPLLVGNPNKENLEKAKTLIENTIAPKTYMGTDEWTALTTVWTILLEITNDPNFRRIHGKVKDYITIPLPPYKLWIVGKMSEGEEWSFIGVFDTEQRAINACVHADYGYGPALLNETLPDEVEEWEGWTYPLTEEAEKVTTNPTTGETISDEPTTPLQKLLKHKAIHENRVWSCDRQEWEETGGTVKFSYKDYMDILEHVVDVEQALAELKEIHNRALDCVDEAFQPYLENKETVLPDFCMIGDDKFEAVPKLARYYKGLTETFEDFQKLRQAEINEFKELKKERDELQLQLTALQEVERLKRLQWEKYVKDMKEKLNNFSA